MGEMLGWWLTSVLAWARENDIPNWFAVGFSSFVWPVAVIVWQRRRVGGVRGLDVHFHRGNIQMYGKDFPALDIDFTNHTGSVVYVTGVRVRGCTSAFPVPEDAARDIAGLGYQLKFLTREKLYEQREATLHTNASARTCMPVVHPLPQQFFTYARPTAARMLRLRKYFVLEYTVMVGERRHSVATRY